MNKCRDCQHWLQSEDEPNGWGFCRIAMTIYSLALPVTTQTLLDESHGGINAGKLKTHAQFGCVQFEPK